MGQSRSAPRKRERRKIVAKGFAQFPWRRRCYSPHALSESEWATIGEQAGRDAHELVEMDLADGGYVPLQVSFGEG